MPLRFFIFASDLLSFPFSFGFVFCFLPWPRPIGPLGSALILFPPSFFFDLYSLSDLNAFSCLPFLYRSFQFSPFLVDLFCIFCLEALFGLASYMHFVVWPHLPLSLFTFTFYFHFDFHFHSHFSCSQIIFAFTSTFTSTFTFHFHFSLFSLLFFLFFHFHARQEK